MSTPTVIILAGGENSRFFPLNTYTHKGALTMMGKPFIVRTLESLQQSGFNHVVIVVSPKDYDGSGLSGFLQEFEFNGVTIEYVLQPQALGMGDAVLLAKEKIAHDFAVIYPTLLNAGVQLRKAIDQAGEGGAIEVAYTQEPWLYGIVSIDKHRVTGIVEKPPKGTEKSNLKQHELYFLSHEFLAFLEETPKTEYSFEAAVDKFVQAFEVHAVEEVTMLPSLKYPWHLFNFQEHLFSSLPNYVSPYAQVSPTAVIDEHHGHVYIENGAKIGHCAKIVGPCFIGEDAVVGDYSVVRQSSIEKGAKVGSHSDVARSIMMEGSSLHEGFIGDSIVGPQAKIGAGFITSNLRLDRLPVSVEVKGVRIDTKQRKLGTVIGQGATIGIRVSTMPGKFIGTGAVVYPSAIVYNHVPHHGVLKVKTAMDLQTKE